MNYITSSTGEKYYFGWEYKPEETFKFLTTLENPYFVNAAPNLKGTGENKDVFFWELEEKVLGRVLPSWNQLDVGSCVAFGWGRAAQDSLLVGITKNKFSWGGSEVATEPIYGGSRVEVGGGQLSGDGSLGSWAAKWVSKWGLLFRTTYLNNKYDLSEYNTTLCRKWGDNGVPNDLEPIAKEKPVKQVALITSASQAVDALANYKPIAICGSKGRTMQRQPGGWCRVEGRWAHCQELCGTCVVKGNTPAVVYRNSWGDYLGDTNNVVTLESGREIKLPQGCYLSRLEEIESELRQQDTFALSEAEGFPVTDLSWLI